MPEALKHIISETHDVLLSDLHMPGAGDRLTVVSAMRHAYPRAITLLLTPFPEMGAATHAILLQTDQILVKPIRFKGAGRHDQAAVGKWTFRSTGGGKCEHNSGTLGPEHHRRLVSERPEGRIHPLIWPHSFV